MEDKSMKNNILNQFFADKNVNFNTLLIIT